MGKRGNRKVKQWTLTGAARAAREARIATANWSRNAPIARRWEMAKLVNAYTVHHTQTGDSKLAQALLFGGLGWQRPYPASWPEAAERVLAEEATALSGADLYILTPDMLDVVIAAAESLTIDDLQYLAADDLPAPSGLLILPRPLLVSAASGNLGDDRAYLWHTPATVPKPDRDRPGRDIAGPAVRITMYHDSRGPVQPDSFLAFAAQARLQGTPLPPLILDGVRCVPFEYTHQSPILFQQSLEAQREVGERLRATAAAAGHNENRVVDSGRSGTYTSGEQIYDYDDQFTVRFLFAFWRLCAQRIGDARPAEVNHSARAAAERAGVPAEARVVQLRRSDRPRNDDTRQRDWQHRWVVRMHRVRQWYPSENRHKIIYRGPYIKGPDDKPLLDGETVQALVR